MRVTKRRLANRAQLLEESSTVGLTRRVDELRASGIAILDLSAGQPDFPSPRVAIEHARTALGDGRTGYTTAAGLSELRSGLGDRFRCRWGAPWGPDETIVTVGAKAALFQIFQVLIDPGDEVVVPTPAWVSFGAQVELAGGRIVSVPMEPADGFALRAEPLIAAIGPRTRAVILNSPCNPTGAVIERDELERLGSACSDHGVVLVADETYEHLVYDRVTHSSAAMLAAREPDSVVVVGSFSKGYSMTGWRIGFALGPQWLIRAMTKLQGHMTSNATTFSMWGALAALTEAEGEAKHLRQELQQRRDLLLSAIRPTSAVECASPDGALYLFARLASSLRLGSVEVAEVLLERGGVAVVPGIAFDAEGYLRLCFARSPEVLTAAAAQICEVLDGLME